MLPPRKIVWWTIWLRTKHESSPDFLIVIVLFVNAMSFLHIRGKVLLLSVLYVIDVYDSFLAYVIRDRRYSNRNKQNTYKGKHLLYYWLFEMSKTIHRGTSSLFSCKYMWMLFDTLTKRNENFRCYSQWNKPIKVNNSIYIC